MHTHYMSLDCLDIMYNRNYLGNYELIIRDCNVDPHENRELKVEPSITQLHALQNFIDTIIKQRLKENN